MTTETAEKKLAPGKQLQVINQELATLKERVKALKVERAALKEKVKANKAAREAKKAGKAPAAN